MNKFIPLFLGLMFPLTGAFADTFTDEAVEFCRSKGGSYSMGSMVEEGENYCRQVICKKTNSDKYELKEGDKGPEANVEATKRVCVKKSVVDGNFDTAGSGNSSGSGSTSGSAGGATSGSGSTGGATSGSGSTGGATSGSGSAGGATSGSGSGSGDAYYCEELEGEGRILPGSLCYNECKPKRDWKTLWTQKKSGFERASCVECLLKYPGVYRVKREFLPVGKDGRIIGDVSVDLGRGVTVKTGVIVCKDSKGNIVNVNGTSCPTGTTIVTGGAGSGSGGTLVIGGGAVGGAVGGSGAGVGGSIGIGGSVGGGVQLPAYCHSTKQKDIDKCSAWMQANKRFLCSSSGNPSLCMGSEYNEISARYDTQNCVNCGVGSRQQSTLSGIAEIVGAIAPPLAQFGSAYVGAKAYQRSNEAWAGAAETGFEQCRLNQANYLQYLSSNELPGLTPAQQSQMNCNGFQLGGYAGLQNPGLGGYYGAGYTPGFIGGMMGPYGGYNPYGGGGYVGGAVGGYVGGMNGGMTGGYPGGMAGGYVNGISIAGGINGGYTGGYAGGYPGGYAAGGVGGMSGGYPGGYAAGGYVGGMNGGYAGGMNGGYPGGMAGGLVNGISIAGGINGGYTGGYAGGYPGGMAGGYGVGGVAGGYAGGYPGGVAGGYGVGGVAGGYPGGYMAGGQVGGGYAGGYTGGYAGGGYGGDLAGSQQAANYDRMMQQQGTSYQMGMGGLGGYSGGYSQAGMYPSNLGIGLSGQIGIGGSFGMY